MRIISLLPAATQMLFKLGAGCDLVGISQDSRFVPGAENLPLVTQTVIDVEAESIKIDETVSRLLRQGKPLYEVNVSLFQSLKPDLILTQELCDVCAVTPNDFQKVLRDLTQSPEVVSLHPHTLTEISENILEVGQAVKKNRAAEDFIDSLKKKTKFIWDKTLKIADRPKVFCLEWLDPPYNAGHWVPEMVAIAGGVDGLSAPGAYSVRISLQKIIDYDPQFIILMPCSFSLKRSQLEYSQTLAKRKEWRNLAAVKNNQVYLVNGPAYFNCPGPCVFEGIELLASIIHPENFPNKFDSNDFLNLLS